MYINQSNEWERRGTLCFLLIPGKLDTYSQGASIQYSKVSKVVQVFVIVTLQSYCCKTSLVIFASLLKSEKSFLINKIQLSLQNASNLLVYTFKACSTRSSSPVAGPIASSTAFGTKIIGIIRSKPGFGGNTSNGLTFLQREIRQRLSRFTPMIFFEACHHQNQIIDLITSPPLLDVIRCVFDNLEIAMFGEFHQGIGVISSV